MRVPAGQTHSSYLPCGLQTSTETTGGTGHFGLAFPQVVLPREHLDLEKHDSLLGHVLLGSLLHSSPGAGMGKCWHLLVLAHCCFNR